MYKKLLFNRLGKDFYNPLDDVNTRRRLFHIHGRGCIEPLVLYLPNKVLTVPVLNPHSLSGLIQRTSRGQVLAERCQDLGSGAKTYDLSGQREAKIWVFWAEQNPSLGFLWTELRLTSRRLDVLHLMRETPRHLVFSYAFWRHSG